MTRSQAPLQARHNLLLATGLVALVIATYWSSLHGAFLWDDDTHVTNNPCIIGPLGFRAIWTTAEANYFPLVLTNFWVQHALWGLNPLGYHAVTIGCHAIAAILAWLILRRIAIPGAWLGAALWAIHPLQTESVAWICELKNTQSAVFFFLCLWLLLQTEMGVGFRNSSASSPQPKRHALALYVGAILCAVFATLSKPTAVMLPVAILLVMWWNDRPINRRALSLIAPFFAIAVAASLWTIWEQKVHSGASGVRWNQSLIERAVVAGRIPWFYLSKLTWPHPLSFIYERWSMATSRIGTYIPLASSLVLVTLAWFFRRNRAVRPAVFAFALFALLLLPVLDIFDVYFFRYAYVGDHFQYLAGLGPLVLLSAVIQTLPVRHSVAIAVLIVAAYAGLTMRECRNFQNNEKLWTSSLAGSPNSPLPLTQMGMIYVQRGDHDAAFRYFNAALKADPTDFYAQNDIGYKFLKKNKWAEAKPHLMKAVELQPESAEAHNNLAFAYQNLGQISDALREYRTAIQLAPKYVDAHNNLGLLAMGIGDFAAAIAHFRFAIHLRPENSAFHHNLGNALRLSGRLDEAVSEFNTALAANPSSETIQDLGNALLALNRTEDAIHRLAQAKGLNPDLPRIADDLANAYTKRGVELASAGDVRGALDSFDIAISNNPALMSAHLNRGTVLARLNDWRGARDAYGRAVDLNPADADAQRNLAIALATTGELSASATHFEAALRIQPNNPSLHRSLSLVLERLGQSSQAMKESQLAETLERDPTTAK